MRNKVVSAAEAAALIKDGDTLTTSGFVGIGVPDELLAAIETRFLETGQPRDLSLVFAAGQGDGKHRADTGEYDLLAAANVTLAFRAFVIRLSHGSVLFLRDWYTD